METKTTKKPTLNEKLAKIQLNLKAPKGQKNTFGNYRYRSCEDILEALKPHLAEEPLTLSISDELVMIGDRYYVRATVTLTDGEQEIKTQAYAREEEIKKGMDSSQITGAASSYARKYALNGMFLIDDTKDADATNDHKEDNTNKVFEKKLRDSKTLEELMMHWAGLPVGAKKNLEKVKDEVKASLVRVVQNENN